MRDGRTRKIERAERGDPSFDEYRRRWRSSLVLVGGGAEGTEFPIERPQSVLGRGPDVDLLFDDRTLSRQHAAIEFTGRGFRVRDLGSMNGMWVNGKETRVADLASGDRIQIGELALQWVVEKCEGPSRTYVLPDDGDEGGED